MEIEFLQKKPFYIFKIENFLDDSEYQTLEENFPTEGIDKIAPLVGNKRSFDVRDELYKSLSKDKNLTIEILEKKFNDKFCIDLLKKLRKEVFISRFVNLTNLTNLKYLYSLIRKPKLVTKECKKNFIQKILYSHFQRFIEFSYMYKESFFHPHTDQKSKLMSLMLYFPSKNLENLSIGTTFYNSKMKNFYNKNTALFDEENNSIFKENLEETITLPFKKKNLYCFIKSDLSWH